MKWKKNSIREEWLGHYFKRESRQKPSCKEAVEKLQDQEEELKKKKRYLFFIPTHLGATRLCTIVAERSVVGGKNQAG